MLFTTYYYYLFAPANVIVIHYIGTSIRAAMRRLAGVPRIHSSRRLLRFARYTSRCMEVKWKMDTSL